MTTTFRLLNVVGWYEEGYLPVRNCTLSWKRNDIGTVDASLLLAPGTPEVRPGEHVLVIEEDGLPKQAHMIWAVDWDTSAAYVTLRGSEYPSILLKRRRVRANLNYGQWEQVDIARDLVNRAQGGPGVTGGVGWGPSTVPAANLHIDVMAGQGFANRQVTGIHRDRNYAALDRKVVWEALTQLGGVIDGFDIFFWPHYNQNTGALEFFLEFEYPTGAQHTEIVLEHRSGWAGSSVVKYTWPWDGTDLVNRAEAGDETQVVTAQDATAWQRYPLLEDMAQTSTAEDTVTTTTTLMEHAQALLQQNRYPLVSSALTLRSDVRLEPDILAKLVRLRLTSWRHPPADDGGPGYDADVRIDAIDYAMASEERPAEITLTVGEMPWATARRSVGASAAELNPVVATRNVIHGLQTQVDALWAALRRRP